MKKTRKLGLLVIALLLFAAPSAWAAYGDTQDHWAFGNLHIIEIIWTADAAGNFTSVNTDWRIDGMLTMVETAPGTGAYSPAANYDITLTTEAVYDANSKISTTGADAMGGSLANRSQTAAELARPVCNSAYRAVPVKGPLTINIANITTANATGAIRIYYIRQRY